MILSLVDKDDPILREVMPEVDFDNFVYAAPTDNEIVSNVSKPQPVKLARDLADTMLKYNGIGLAANQVGLRHRVFAIKSNPVMVCFNPILVDVSEKTELLDEGCLSIPGMFAKVRRPSIIKARWTRPDGETITEKYSGLTARIFLHELSHLNGELFTDYLSSLVLVMAIKKANKNGFKYKISDFRNKFETTQTTNAPLS